MDILEIARNLALSYIPFLFALCVHEWAHGWMAKRRGDDTAELMGRLTLNPIAHMDLIGTLILPVIMMSGIFGGGILFGWAKPVPVNIRNLSRPKEDMFWIALAGPVSNIIQAFLGAILLVFAFSTTLLGNIQGSIVEMLRFYMIINLFLAFFNLIPVHPLDGGKILDRFLSPQASMKLEENQQILMIVAFGLVFTGVLSTPVTWVFKMMISVVIGVVS